ncbi:hypothetical protein ENBRE01_2603 [Enteropsectra breve]|nr:hypothetical protein ENBRE01_2603 [Enteropsectra breve]
MRNFQNVVKTPVSKDTIKLLKQHKFKRFGLRGIFSKADEAYLFELFKPENDLSVEELDENLISLDADRFNNLRNSVTTLDGIEDAIKLATDYHLLPNIEHASVFRTLNDNHFDFYETEKESLARLEEFKSSNENKMPLPLISLTLISEKQSIDIYHSTTRKQEGAISNNSFLKEKTGRATNNPHTVSRLRILTPESYEEELKVIETIHAFNINESILEITIASKHAEYNERFLSYFRTLKFKGEDLVLNLDIDGLISKKNNETKISSELLEIIRRLYKEYIQTHEGKKIIVRPFSKNMDYYRQELFKDQIYSYLIKESISSEERSVLSEKIVVEVAPRHYTRSSMLLSPHYM